MPVVPFTVRRFQKVTPRSRILTLELAGARFPFAAGQAALIGLNGERRKPYSIACAPEDAALGGVLDFLIGLDPSGVAGDHLAGVRRGSVLLVEGPVGAFRFPRRVHEPQILFVAGGTGIAPVRSMIRHALAVGYGGRVTLAYSARSDRDFAVLPELRRLARDGHLDLALTVTRNPSPRWRGERGRFTAARLGSLLDSRATLCFVCGPRALVDGVSTMLRSLGVSQTRIRVDRC